MTSLSDHGRFTALGQVSDTLEQICEIRDDISYAIHCNQIPTIFIADLENTGYHRQFYVRYTANLIRLEDGRKLLSPTPPRRHSTPNSSSARSNLTVFAPEGIFCEKVEKKCGDR